MWRATVSRRLAIIHATISRNGPGSAMIALSENRLNRNGRTAARLSGPPRLNSTTAILVMKSDPHPRHQPRDMVGRRGGQHAMAKVEDEAPSLHRVADAVDRGIERRAAHQQQHGIEIALQRDLVRQRLDSPAE